ncbi:MAG TPA: B12-binding domain-containing radical SAM protein [Spirochaetota bacterium]|mgnify:CR=1 FL=1|nr:B12-binding domain-containing radical SAM protein [Spirochaetota bacterium]
MNTRVLMIYPEIPSTYWSMKHALQFVGNKSSMPPLGLMTIAAMLPARYDVRLLDMNVEPLTDEAIERADLVFISAMIVQKKSFEEAVARCRRFGKTIAAGGPYPTSSHGAIAGVDHFVLGEGEITLPRFLADYEAGCALPCYECDEKPDISTTPVPRMDLIDTTHYGAMALQYSRGCPFNCEFCDIIEMFGRKPRVKTPAQFVAELEAVYATGYRGSLFVVDDNFIGNKRTVKELLPAVEAWQRERGFPFSLFTEASVNLAGDAELMALMVAAGFDSVFLGIETPVEKSLEQAQKGQNMKGDLLTSVETIQRAGLEVMAGFIVGFDGDPDNVFDLQIEFIRKSGIPMAMVGMLMALPKTQLHRRLEREGRLLAETTGDNCDLDVNFVTTIPHADLVAGYKRIIEHIYTPRHYFARGLDLLRRLPRRPVASGATTVRDLRALVRSLFVQTFSSYGHRYLAFLARALWINPRRFALAANLAIKEYHFNEITTGILAADRFAAVLEGAVGRLDAELERMLAKPTPAHPRRIERRGRAIVAQLRKKYGQLPGDLPESLHAQFAATESRCEERITHWAMRAHLLRQGLRQRVTFDQE